MRTTKFWMGAVVAGAVALGFACSDDNEPTFGDVPEMPDFADVPPDAGGIADAGLLPDAGTMMTLTDAQIARVLQVANEGEVMLGQYAAPLATNTAVRDFNNQMATEHTAVKQRLDALLTAQGIVPEDSPVSIQLQNEVQQLMQVLQGPDAPTGAALDLALISAQLNAHARTAFVGDSLLTLQTDNPQLAQELMTERQTVQQHIQAARDIQSNLVMPPATP
ncbi:DUF4142 domain-containing protein [Corallococcus exercitus]|uniref:DUF4142 domain-containing protein n=1 Tax=Corallococcus exercitus TaxID=2316736 RepID=A0A3A8HGV2_9BACT|nr:DUF4142 domain-containing protein [Corallococcus exercitus]NOK39083.1 DUF4142 domain-containing protein [Corallococcus exercitus]RKG66844.1 DUF4142 domain-containing protein [Corallococcus exercitus]